MGNMILTSHGHLILSGRYAVLRGLIFLSLITIFAGQAAADQSINFLYHPTGLGKGGSGDLYLGQNIHPLAGRPSVEWIIGQTKNRSGEKTGNIVSARPPVDTVMEAFSEEFKAAGYNVIPVEVLPEGVAKGIRLTIVSIRVEKIDLIYKAVSKCTVKVSLEPWLKGRPLKRLDYESYQEDSTFINRDMILLKSEQDALQQLIVRAVREAIVLLEGK
jgi:hypothetical protein